MFPKLTDSLIIRIVMLVILGTGITIYATAETVRTIFEKSLEDQLDQHLIAYTDILAGTVTTRDREFIINKDDPLLKSIPRYWQIDTPEKHLAKSYLQKQWIPFPEEITLSSRRITYKNAMGENIIAVRQELKFPNGEILLITSGLEKHIADTYKNKLAAGFKKDVNKALAFLSVILLLTAIIIIMAVYFPLQRVSNALTAVRQGKSNRIEGKYPREITNLSDQINQLLEYTSNVMERHRTFSGNLSHALKTPLTAIRNETESDIIKDRIDLMLQVIDRNLSRANSAGNTGILALKTSICPILSRISDSFGKVYSKDIQLNCPEHITLNMNEADLYEIAGNIVENACKYAKQNILVKATENTIIVEDDGPGIDPSEYETIFTRGLSLDQSKPGSGIGLPITRDLVTLYGGSLELSKSDLGGLKVIISL